MAQKPAKIKMPKGRNPVAATLRDPRSGFTQRTIPDKRETKIDRKRKHKGRPFDEI